jgi:hypothetical protein
MEGAAELRHQLLDAVAEIDVVEAVAGGGCRPADLKRGLIVLSALR